MDLVSETVAYLAGDPTPFVIPATRLQLGIQDVGAIKAATFGYAMRKASAYAANKCTCGACTWTAHGKANWA